jgi:hypothetical protein
MQLELLRVEHMSIATAHDLVERGRGIDTTVRQTRASGNFGLRSWLRPSSTRKPPRVHSEREEMITTDGDWGGRGRRS